MKTYIVLLAVGLTFVVLCFAFWIPVANAEDKISVIYGKGISNPDKFTIELTRTANQREVVWGDDDNPDTSIFPWKIVDVEPYRHAKIIASDATDNSLLVLFEIQFDKVSAKVKELPLQTVLVADGWAFEGNDFNQWNGKLLFLRSFVRDQSGKWKIHISAFPETFWRSGWNVHVKRIELISDNEYAIVYDSKWEMRKINDTQRFEKVITDEKGETIRRFKYDPINDLLLTADFSDSFVYVSESDWWTGKDEWYVGPFASQDMTRKRAKLDHFRKAFSLKINGRNNIQR